MTRAAMSAVGGSRRLTREGHPHGHLDRGVAGDVDP